MTTQVAEMIPEASRDAAAPRDRADVTALVVSADPEIREGWARWIERDGGRATSLARRPVAARGHAAGHHLRTVRTLSAHSVHRVSSSKPDARSDGDLANGRRHPLSDEAR